KYIGVKEAAKKWGISDRRVRILCEQGRIEGAIKLEWSWTIPADTPKPFDGRLMRPFKNYSVRLGTIDISALEKLKESIPAPDRESELYGKLIEDSLFLALTLGHKKYNEKEVRTILKGKVISSYPLSVHLLYSNFRSLIKREEVSTLPWDSKRMMSLHRYFLQGVDDINGGIYRDGFAEGQTSDGDRLKVTLQMETLFIQFERDWKAIHPVFKAVLMFGETMKIKPFEAYNEEFAVLLLSAMLVSAGYLPPALDASMADEINAALTLALRRGSYQDLARIVERSIIKSYHMSHV
ncbi:MAG: hypothetical protein ACI4NM_07920, partial [Bullifex sp.]